MNITSDQKDALQEVITIGVGQAAEVLNQMIDDHISLKAPTIKLLDLVDTSRIFGEAEQFSSVELGFSGSLEGRASLIFPTQSALNLVALLSGETSDVPDFNSVKKGTLSEIGNIVLNCVMGELGNMVGKHLDFHIPEYTEAKRDQLFIDESNNKGERIALVCNVSFHAKQQDIQGDITLIFEMGSFRALLEYIDDMLKVA